MIAQTCDVLHSNTQISRHVFFFCSIDICQTNIYYTLVR